MKCRTIEHRDHQTPIPVSLYLCQFLAGAAGYRTFERASVKLIVSILFVEGIKLPFVRYGLAFLWLSIKRVGMVGSFLSRAAALLQKLSKLIFISSRKKITNEAGLKEDSSD